MSSDVRCTVAVKAKNRIFEDWTSKAKDRTFMANAEAEVLAQRTSPNVSARLKEKMRQCLSE